MTRRGEQGPKNTEESVAPPEVGREPSRVPLEMHDSEGQVAESDRLEQRIRNVERVKKGIESILRFLDRTQSDDNLVSRVTALTKTLLGSDVPHSVKLALEELLNEALRLLEDSGVEPEKHETSRSMTFEEMQTKLQPLLDGYAEKQNARVENLRIALGEDRNSLECKARISKKIMGVSVGAEVAILLGFNGPEIEIKGWKVTPEKYKHFLESKLSGLPDQLKNKIQELFGRDLGPLSGIQLTPRTLEMTFLNSAPAQSSGRAHFAATARASLKRIGNSLKELMEAKTKAEEEKKSVRKVPSERVEVIPPFQGTDDDSANPDEQEIPDGGEDPEVNPAAERRGREMLENLRERGDTVERSLPARNRRWFKRVVLPVLLASMLVSIGYKLGELQKEDVPAATAQVRAPEEFSNGWSAEEQEMYEKKERERSSVVRTEPYMNKVEDEEKEEKDTNLAEPTSGVSQERRGSARTERAPKVNSMTAARLFDFLYPGEGPYSYQRKKFIQEHQFTSIADLREDPAFQHAVNNSLERALRVIYEGRTFDSPEWNTWKNYLADDVIKMKDDAVTMGRVQDLRDFLRKLLAEGQEADPNFSTENKTVDEFVRSALERDLLYFLAGQN